MGRSADCTLVESVQSSMLVVSEVGSSGLLMVDLDLPRAPLALVLAPRRVVTPLVAMLCGSVIAYQHKVTNELWCRYCQ